MLLLDRQPGATAQPREEANRPNVSTGRVQLRLRANGQVLELPPGKTTIGSSPRCNVRIEQPGVQPLHCLIVEGPEGLRVRSWVANTTLNGVPFEESALVVGDCLSLGTVELEVIDPQAGKSQPKAVEAPVVKSKDAELVRAGRDQARSRSRRLLETLRHERSAHQELCQQVAKLQEAHLDAITEQNEISGKLESSLAELAAARLQLGDYQAVETARQQLAARNDQLGFEIGELSAQINELKQRQAEAAAERQKSADNIAALEEQQRQLVETNSRLQSEAAQFANEKAAADEQNRQFAEGKSQLQDQFVRLSDEKNAISEQHRQLIEANARLQIELGQLTNEKGAADERCWKLAEEKSQLQSECSRLADEKNALSDEHRQRVEANSGLQSQVDQLANEKGSADEQCRRLSDEKSQLQSAFDRLAEEKNTINEQYQLLIESTSGLQSQIGQLANEKATADEQCRQLTEQKSQLQIEFDRLAEEKNAINEAHRQLGEMNSRLQSDVVQLANEKAAAEEHNRQLVQQMSQLTHEVGHLTEQKAELEGEREGLRHQNEQLLSEARELAGERGSLADERTALCQERSELRQQNELLRTRIAQLNDENSAMAVGKLTLVEQRDTFNREAEELRVRVAELSEENTTLAAAKATLADEQTRLVAEQKRLAELEREMGAAVAGRENTSAELYNALLQLAEMQERDAQNKAVIEAYESLSKEHDHLHNEADQLKEQNQRLSEERAAVEGAWQALSAEAATLGESQQRMADENATLVASLDEARQQLELAEQERATLASVTAELERERAAKLQAEADVAAAIAEGEQRLAEQERRFAEQAQQYAEQSSEFNERSRQQAEQARELAESVNRLERQLAAAGETRESLARAREESQLELANAESRWVEQLRQIHELESQLAAAEERAAQAAELAASLTEASRKIVVVEPVLSAPEHAEVASHVASEEPAEFHWPSARSESAPHDELNASGGEDLNSHKSLDEPTADKAAWHSAGSEVSTDDASAEPAVYAWSNTTEPSAAAEEPNPWGEKVSPPAPVDASTFGEDEGVSPVEPEIAFADPVFAKPEESVEQEIKTESSPKPKLEQVSYLERYSHLLVEDDAAAEEKPLRLNESAPVRPPANAVARPAEATMASKTEEEDSIEQYMAKLLQRVRGDSEGGKAAREQPSRMPLNAPSSKPAGRPVEQSVPLAIAAPESHSEGEANAIDAPPSDRSEWVKRRATSPAPATNLGALRALANETARLAISRHELRKLRRNAVTKVIVSTLAGVTSLWLMLDSEDWRSMQFLTACGASMVAVYWAAETFRTLINSMRVAPYEGPEETAAVESPALPIDVESNEQR